MEISKQIKKHRLDAELSQEELAEKIFVTRQTISNWENNRSYPDINSLILLSNFFDISLDILVKGDLEEMKEEIKLEDIQQFNRDSKIYTALLAALVLSAAPLLFYLHRLGIVLWAALWSVSMYFAYRVDKQKKAHDIQTYREIVAFSEGQRLDEIQKNREIGKRPYQKVLIVLLVTFSAFFVSYGMSMLLNH